MSSLSSWTRSPGSAFRTDRTPLKDQTHEQLQDHVKRLEKDLRDAQGRLTRSHHDTDRLIKEIKVYNKRHQEDQAVINQLRAATADNTSLQAKVKELDLAHGAEHLEYLKQLAACQKAEQKYAALAKQLEELSRLRADLYEKTATIERRDEQLTAAQQQVQDSQLQLSAAQHELVLAKQQLQPLQQQLSEAQQRNTALQQQYSELSEGHQQLQEEHAAANALADRQADTLVELEQQLAAAHAALQVEQSAKADMELELRSTKVGLQTSQAETAAAMADVQRMQEESDQQRQMAEQWSVQIPRLLQERDEAAAQLEQQQCKLLKLRGECDMLQQAQQTAQGRVNTSTEREAALLLQLEELQGMLAKLSEDVAQPLAKQAAAAAALGGMQSILQAVAQQQAAHEGQPAAQESADVGELQQQVDQQQRELAAVKDELCVAQTAAAQVQQLQQELQKVEADLAAAREHAGTAAAVAARGTELQQQLEEHQCELDAAKEQLATAREAAAQTQQLQQQLEDVLAELAAAKDQLACAKASIAQAQQRGIADALKAADEGRKAAAKRLVNQEQRENESALQEHAQELNNQVSQLHQELNAVNALLTDAVTRAESAERDMGANASRLLTLQQQLQEKNTSLQEQQALLAEAQAGQQLLQSKLDEIHADNENLMEDNDQLRSLLDNVRGQLNESRHSATEAQKLAALSTADANLARSQYAQLQHLLSAQRNELRFAHRAIAGVRQQLQPLPQSLSNLAAGIAAGQSGLAAVDLEADRLVFTLGNTDHKESDADVSVSSAEAKEQQENISHAADIAVQLKETIESALEQATLTKMQAEELVQSLTGCDSALDAAARILAIHTIENSTNQGFSEGGASGILVALQADEADSRGQSIAGAAEQEEGEGKAVTVQQQEEAARITAATSSKRVSFGGAVVQGSEPITPVGAAVAAAATAEEGVGESEDIDQPQQFFTCLPETRMLARTNVAEDEDEPQTGEDELEQQQQQDETQYAAIPQLCPWPVGKGDASRSPGGAVSPASSSTALPSTPTSTPAHSLTAAHSHWPGAAGAAESGRSSADARQRALLSAAAASAAAATGTPLLDPEAAEAAVRLLSRMAEAAMLYPDEQELEGVVQAAATAAAHALQQQDEADEEGSDLELEGSGSGSEQECVGGVKQADYGGISASHWSLASLAGGASTVTAFDGCDDDVLQSFVEGASAVGSAASSVHSFGSASGIQPTTTAAAEDAANRQQLQQPALALHAMADVAAAAAEGKFGGVPLDTQQAAAAAAVDELPTPHFWRHPAVYSPARSFTSPGSLPPAKTGISSGSPAASIQSVGASTPATAAKDAAAGGMSPAASSEGHALLPGSFSPGMMFMMSPVGMTPTPAGTREAAAVAPFGAEQRQQQTGGWIHSSSGAPPAADDSSSSSISAGISAGVGSPALDSPGNSSLSGISFAHPSPKTDQTWDMPSPVYSGGAARSPPRNGAAFRAHGSGLGVPRLNLGALQSSSSFTGKRGSSVGAPIHLPPVPGCSTADDSAAGSTAKDEDVGAAIAVQQLAPQIREPSVSGSFGLLGSCSVGEPFTLPPVPDAASVSSSDSAGVTQPQQQLPKEAVASAETELAAADVARPAEAAEAVSSAAAASPADVASPSLGSGFGTQEQQQQHVTSLAANSGADSGALSSTSKSSSTACAGLGFPKSASVPAATAAGATPALISLKTPVHPLLQQLPAATPGPEAYFTAPQTAPWQQEPHEQKQDAELAAAAAAATTEPDTGDAPFGGFFAFARQQQDAAAAVADTLSATAGADSDLQQQPLFFTCRPDSKTAARTEAAEEGSAEFPDVAVHATEEGSAESPDVAVHATEEGMDDSETVRLERDAESAAAAAEAAGYADSYGADGSNEAVRIDDAASDAGSVASGTGPLPAAAAPLDITLAEAEESQLVEQACIDDDASDAGSAASAAGPSATSAQVSAWQQQQQQQHFVEHQGEVEEEDWEQVEVVNEAQDCTAAVDSEGSAAGLSPAASINSSTAPAAADEGEDGGSRSSIGDATQPAKGRQSLGDVVSVPGEPLPAGSSSSGTGKAAAATTLQQPSVSKPVIRRLVNELDEADSGTGSDSDYFFSKKALVDAASGRPSLEDT